MLKFLAGTYLVVLLLCAAQHAIDGSDFSTLLSQRLFMALAVCAGMYPFVGFVSVREPLPAGGMARHGQPLVDIMARADYRLAESDGGKLVFRAASPVARAVALFEDEVTMEIGDDGLLRISGTRKRVSRIRLRVGDYVRSIT
ncbi:MAG: hypothetical protein LBS63_01600 [Prevotellaceae bacterium]|nr:hypothetical protein [Prevotellaceae bacterium]